MVNWCERWRTRPSHPAQLTEGLPRVLLGDLAVAAEEVCLAALSLARRARTCRCCRDWPPASILQESAPLRADRRLGVPISSSVSALPPSLPAGAQCCENMQAAHRRRANNQRLGRTSAHWRRLSRRARELQPFCSACGGSADLTADLVGGGDHRLATLERLRVLCRRCHRPGGAYSLGSGWGEKSCHSPGTPFSGKRPRSLKRIPEPATRSLTVLETRASPG